MKIYKTCHEPIRPIRMSIFEEALNKVTFVIPSIVILITLHLSNALVTIVNEMKLEQKEFRSYMFCLLYHELFFAIVKFVLF